MRRARYAKIDRLVEQLLAERQIRKPAVPVARMLSDAGIEIRAGDLGKVSGLLARLPDAVIVGVNSTQGRQRQRFTMAHEYGHYLLHEGISAHSDENFALNFRDDVSKTATNVEEIEANYFAASLLMPRSFLDADRAAEALDSDAKVGALAKRFDVSRLAMSLRLANLYGRHLPF